jgi:hypothetical protein
MRSKLWIVSFSLLAAAATPAFAGFGEAGEVEAARANARAGGPISEHEAYLLERYGCLSGTDNPVCFRSRAEYDSEHRYRINKHHYRRHHHNK